MAESMQDLVNKLFKDVTRDQCEASALLQKSCFVKWMASGRPSGYSSLAARMEHAKPAPTEVSHPYTRVADALVQKLRKAGMIERTGREWKLTEAGQELLEFVAEDIKEQDLC